MANTANTKPITATLPRSPAVWPKLDQPDTKWKPEGEYVTKQRIPLADAEPFMKQIDELAERHLAAVRKKLIEDKKPAEAKKLSLSKDKPYVAEVDEDGNETGYITIKAKMKASGVSKKTSKPWKRKPPIYDAKLQPITACPPIGGGSELKVSVTFEAYDNAKREVGVTCRLEAVQLLVLRTFADKDAAQYGFGAEEGGYEDDGTGQSADTSEETQDSGEPESASDF